MLWNTSGLEIYVSEWCSLVFEASNRNIVYMGRIIFNMADFHNSRLDWNDTARIRVENFWKKWLNIFHRFYVITRKLILSLHRYVKSLSSIALKVWVSCFNKIYIVKIFKPTVSFESRRESLKSAGFRHLWIKSHASDYRFPAYFPSVGILIDANSDMSK